MTLLSPADLYISTAALASVSARVAGVSFPHPSPHKAPPLDSSLPAFERILQLLAGGIAKRKGLVFHGNTEELAGQLFELLKNEGVLRPAAGP